MMAHFLSRDQSTQQTSSGHQGGQQDLLQAHRRPKPARHALRHGRGAGGGRVAQGASGAQKAGRRGASHTKTSTLNFREFLFHALR